MRVLKSMSDIRTKLLLGTTIGALAMIFVMAAGVDSLKSNVSVVESNIPVLLGHVTVTAVHADGSMSYVQTDNVIQNLGRDAALLQLISGTGAGGEFDCMRIGTGDGSGVGIATPMVTTSGQACDTNNASSNPILAAANAGVASGNVVATFPDLVLADLVTVAGVSVTVTEATLEDQNSVVLSHVLLGTAITGNVGTAITINYTMTLT